MKTIFLLLFFFSTICLCFAKSPTSYSQLPDELVNNANAIIRNYNKKIERLYDNQLKTTVTVAVTVLNNEGRYFANLYLPYDKNTKVLQLSGKIYDARGTLIKKIKKKDCSDFSHYQDFVFYSDNRLINYSVGNFSLPYTVEYSYTTQTTDLIHIDFWVPLSGYGIAVENATLELLTPKSLPVIFRTQNYDFKHQATEIEGNTIHYKWQIEQFKALTKESYSPSPLSIFPTLAIAPINYKYDGYSETVTDWTSYGKWVSKLLIGKDVLSADTQNMIQALTDTLSDTMSKVKAVYQYMQSRTRYVAISEGIGGFQPMPASDVDKFAYGDCKALSNYTKALLSSINIPSYYTEIGADNRRIRHSDFASVDQTNHAILTVPIENDTIWLECTNPYNPFGYVGSAIADRLALAVTPEGGKLISMPTYSAEDNIREFYLDLKLDLNGDASATLSFIAKGLRFEELHFLSIRTKKQQQDYLLKTLPLKNLSIDKNELTEELDRNPTAKLNVGFKVGKYAHPSGNRLMMPLNTLSPLSINVKSNNERKSDLHFKNAYTDISHFIYEIPKEAKVEFLPPKITIENDFLLFRSNCELIDNKLNYYRTFTLKHNIVPKENVAEFIETLEKIRKKDNPKAVLKFD